MNPSRRSFLFGSAAGAAVPAVARAESPVGGAPGEAPHRCRVNGREVEVPEAATAVEVIRDRLGLTGTKVSCGGGACGACTVLVDGVPRVTCLLPAGHLHGREVTTIEGLGAGKHGAVRPGTGAPLHPVQRAFMAEDALQCGYCTPGWIVAAAAFHDDWRSAGGPPKEPTRDEIASALAGHLCRCGAYDAIYRAVGAACAGRYDAPEETAARPDAREKVTGAARYTVDVQLPGQLVGRFLRSPHAHAVVRRVDTSAAEKRPGVRATVVLTGEGKKVRFVGQEIVALAALSREEAEAALRDVVVEYDVLPSVHDMAAAMREGAPTVYERGDKPASSSEMPVVPAPWEGNLRGPVDLSIGLRAQRADRLVETPGPGTWSIGEWHTATILHACMEPHAVVARWEGARLEVWCSTQMLSWMADDFAEHFGLAREDVVVHAEYVGGGFGSKAGWDVHALATGELARRANAPVSMVLDRDEELVVAGLRPAQRLAIGVGMSPEGTLDALSCVSFADAGCAVGTNSGVLPRLVYPCKTKRVADYDVVTHTAPGKPMRGPGGPAACFAVESAVDDVAHQAGEDPIALRRRWDPHPVRQRLYERASALPMWRDRGTGQGRYRRGVGVASAFWFYFVEPSTQVSLAVEGGKLVVASATQDMGNGTRSVMFEAVRRVFDVSAQLVQVRVGDSRDVHGPMSGGSRTTASIFPATLDAAGQLAEALAEDTAARLGLAEATASPAGVVHAGGVVPWKDVLSVATRRMAVGRRKRDRGGYFAPPFMGLATGRALGGAVQVSEVEVDTWLGRVEVTRVWMGLGAGKIVAPKPALSQVQGAIVQGIGHALYEERRLDPRTARPLTVGMEDYRIPGIGDIPSMDVHFDEGDAEFVNGGAFGMSELATVPSAASIANAVFHATGWRPRAVPISPVRVLEGLGGVA